MFANGFTIAFGGADQGKRCPRAATRVLGDRVSEMTGNKTGEQRRTNTEPGAVATGSPCETHKRVTCKEICNQTPPGRYSSRFRICDAYVQGYYFARAQLNQYWILRSVVARDLFCFGFPRFGSGN